MPKHFSSAYWRARGEQTRALAEQPMTDEKLQRSLLDIANEYDKLAEFAKAQEHAVALDRPDDGRIPEPNLHGAQGE